MDLKNSGKKIISLNVGEPDFATPEEIIVATTKAAQNNKTKYSLVAGIPELRSAICHKIKKTNQIEAMPENVLVSNGSKQILYSIFQTVINPGDEVIVLTPYWVSFPESIKLAGGIPVFVPNKENHQLDIDAIEKAITNNTRAIVINSPNNPSGAVYLPSDLERLMKTVLGRDLFLVSDEAYETLIFDQNIHLSPASLSPEAFKKTLTVQTLSKSYCMTGFRIGYVIGDQKIIQAIDKLQSHICGNVCTFAQYGALAAFEIEEKYHQNMVQIMQKRRDMALEICAPLFSCPKPGGAFYLFPKIEKYLKDSIKTDEDLTMHILERAGVAVLPGSYFGTPGYLRISFATKDSLLKEALLKMRDIM